MSEGASSCSAPECGDRLFPASFNRASADGLTIVFGSGEPLSGEDVDTDDDIYLRDVREAPRISSLRLGTARVRSPENARRSSGGSPVTVRTSSSRPREQVAAVQDTDSRQDVYGWSGAAPVLVSTGAGGGNGGSNATYQGTTADGSAAFFETGEPLSGEDTDSRRGRLQALGRRNGARLNRPDRRQPGVVGELQKDRAGGSRPLPSLPNSRSPSPMSTPAGTSTSAMSIRNRPRSFPWPKLGAREPVATVKWTRASPAPPAMSPLSSSRRPSPWWPPIRTRASTSTSVRAGETTLVSTGPIAKKGASSPHLADVSEDGGHALITTEERLTIDDLDGETDVYDRSAAGMLLVSTRNPDDLVLGPAVPALTATNPASPGISTEPRILGEADPDTSIKLYATPNCSGAPVATGSSAELEGAGIAVKVAPSSTTSFRATATLLNDTSACSAVGLTYQQAAETGGGGGGSVVGRPGGGPAPAAGRRPASAAGCRRGTRGGAGSHSSLSPGSPSPRPRRPASGGPPSSSSIRPASGTPVHLLGRSRPLALLQLAGEAEEARARPPRVQGKGRQLRYLGVGPGGSLVQGGDPVRRPPAGPFANGSGRGRPDPDRAPGRLDHGGHPGGRDGSLLVGALRAQPGVSQKAADVRTARWVMERLTRELRGGIVINKATASSVSFQTYVRRTACGGTGNPPSTLARRSNARSPTPAPAAPAPGSRPRRRSTREPRERSSPASTTAPASSPTRPRPRPPTWGSRSSSPPPASTTATTVTDGASLRNATLSN